MPGWAVPPEPEPVCAVCGKPILRGEDRHAIQGESFHPRCLDKKLRPKRKSNPSR